MKIQAVSKGLVLAAMTGIVMGLSTPTHAKNHGKHGDSKHAKKCEGDKNCKCDHAKGEKCEDCAKCDKHGCGKDGCGGEGHKKDK